MFRCPRAASVAGPLALAAAGVLPALPAAAEPGQTVSRDLTQAVAASNVGSYGTPDALAGVLATARFSDGSLAQALFATQGSGILSTAFAQVADAFVIVADGGTDSSRPSNWTVTNLSTTRTLVGFTLDGRGLGQGQAGFDVSSFTTSADTPGSNDGSELLMSFTGRTFITGAVTIAYSLPVALNGAAAAGDLFAQVDVSLAYTNAGLNGGLPPNTLFSGVFSSQNFRSDVDLVSYAAVPEPGAGALWAAGLAVLAGLRRRRG